MNELEAARTAILCGVPPESHVLCAVSGGLDSMCLLHFMTQWGAKAGVSVSAAHFHHQLRGDAADRDEAFVRDWCGSRNISFFSGTGDTRALAVQDGLSVEEAARTLRYTFLKQTAKTAGCQVILTAHHADDNAETLLLNLVRGTGLKGLCGIPQERDGILRPFLQITRKELVAYAAAHGIPHVEDETNADPDAAARNRLRLQVMPLLKELNPRAVEHMARTAALLALDDTALEEEARRLCQSARPIADGLKIAWSVLDVFPAVRDRAVLTLLAKAGGSRKDITAAHVTAVLTLAEGKTAVLPYGLTARHAGKWLVLARRLSLPERVELATNTPAAWGPYTLTLLSRPAGEGLALPPGPETVSVGPCPPDGRLMLPGARGPRTVKRLCLDRRIPLWERDGLPAVYLEGRLAAVWRLGVDTEFLRLGEPCRFIQIIKQTEENKHEQ